MAHLIERREDGSYSMAWAGNPPWHLADTHAKKVLKDLTPAQMAAEAQVDWTVSKRPVFYDHNGVQTPIKDKRALVRDFDGRCLSVVGDEWNIVQNAQAAEFFHDFVMAGGMSMVTAGSLQDGRIVWFLAEIDREFSLFKGKDRIKSYLLFSNFHIFGRSTNVKPTDIAVVCHNTFTAAHGDGEMGISVHHRKKFDSEQVKKALGLSLSFSTAYKEQAEFLANKRYTPTDVGYYFDTMFPNNSKKEDADQFYSRNATIALDILDTQPGADIRGDSFWKLFNTVTFMADHVIGHEGNRVNSAWYGRAANLKVKAMDLALEMANKA
jgi:phage/plasmid-like protein (TIGR03299 family)